MRVRKLLLLLLTLAATTPAVMAQSWAFGSVDDPAETPRAAWWNRAHYMQGLGGLSLIGAQWRSAIRGEVFYEGEDAVIHVDGSLRAGIYGPYDPETDESYDAARILRFARFRRESVYVRAGPIRRMRLGYGHLVNFYSGTSSWDERRIGVETVVGNQRISLSGFADDLRMGRLVAGRAEIRPRGGRGRLGSLTLGASYVSDQSRHDPWPTPPDAWQIDVRMRAAESGAFSLQPFVSFAQFETYGRGLLFGADLASDNFIDMIRVSARLAVSYSSSRFVPGYFGSFYDVQNPRSRIVASESDGPFADIPLYESGGGNDILSELRLLVFERFEFWYSFRRHYGFQALSEYHIRLFLRTNRLVFRLSQDRGGLRGFFSLFNDLGDQTLLSFHTSYRLFGPVWLSVDARYGYQRDSRGDSGSAARAYFVQRRFEPFIGVRTRF